jgi:hypothetical protein
VPEKEQKMCESSTYTKTNYVQVSDPARFREIVRTLLTDRDEAELLSKVDEDSGVTRFGFAANGAVCGMCSDELNDPDVGSDFDYDYLIEELQAVIAADECLIILKIENDELRYVAGSANLITKDKVKSVSLSDTSENLAKQMLGDPAWEAIYDD